MNTKPHILQKEILLKLMKSPKGLSFSELLPPTLKLESYKFNYHLGFLVKERLVEKIGRGYRLTDDGLKYLTPYTIEGEISGMHKVSVALFVMREIGKEKELLMQKRSRHPFYGDMTTIGGKVKVGEKITDAAKRKLKEESGLDADFELIGIQRKTKQEKSGEIFEDVFYHYCLAKNPTGELESQNSHGENSWVPFKHVLFLEKDNLDGGDEGKVITKKLLNCDFSWFYIEQNFVLDKHTRVGD